MLAYSPGLNGQPPNPSAHLPADVAAGRTTKVEVSASGSESPARTPLARWRC